MEDRVVLPEPRGPIIREWRGEVEREERREVKLGTGT